jgi:hypothetical protein
MIELIPIYVALISSISALALGILNIVAAKRKADADALRAESEDKKAEASAASELTGAALKMVNDAQADCANLRQRVRSLEEEDLAKTKKIARLELELELARDSIEYLWIGTLKNIEFMEAHNMTPPFKPRGNFRGDDLQVAPKDEND